MKISYISKSDSWNDRQIVKEARKMKVNLKKIDIKDLNDPKIFSSLGDIILWRSSSLDPKAGRTTLLSILIKSKKKVINRSIIDYPGVIFKQFQQAYVKKSVKKINTIPTFTFSSAKDLKEYISKGKLKMPFIMKPNLGAKGVGVELVSKMSDLNKVSEEDIKKNVFQNFIKNNGDYRVLVIGGRPIGAMKRIGKENSFVNNVSMGAVAIKVTDKKLESKLFQIASQVAATFNLGFCGVDVIKDINSGELFFLELNTVPQWEGFQKSTGINVARELLLYCQEIFNSSNKKPSILVKNCYVNHYEKLANKKFHFSTRMFLWTKEKKYLDNLKYLKKDYYGKDDESLKRIFQNILKNSKVYQKRIYNGKEFRKKPADKFPLLGAYSEILFRNLMSKNIFNLDLRPVIKELIDDGDLLEIQRRLLDNKEDILSLSTFSANYLYFLEDYFEKSEKTEVDIEQILDLVEKNIEIKIQNDIELIRNNIYFITHLIIGATKFYAKPIEQDIKIFKRLLEIAEKIVSDNYFSLSLDTKLELLVCGRLINKQIKLEEFIRKEADMSLSEINNFLVDRLNGRSDLSPKSFLGAEHRNVLYMMINS
ncbi:MAG: hypothetical protein ACD_7C00309G0002 [uncultured bacterium]|nr:MAG: hypothetical protein ACD_7C00309G0002 [uncultured bacterium]